MKISNNLKSFLLDSSIYTFLNILNKAIPLLLLPIIVRMLTTEDFGRYSLFISVETLLIPIVSLNLHAALSRHYYSDDFIISDYLSTIMYSILGISFFFFLFIFVVPDFLIKFLGLSSDFFKIAILSASLMGILGMISNLFRLQRKPWFYGIFSILQSLTLFLIIYIFCYINPTYKSVVFGRFFYVISFFLLSILFLRYKKYLLIIFRKKIFDKALKFSLPTVIYSLSAFVFVSSDRFFINHFLDAKEVGYYAAIYQVASVISILGASVNAAWMPWLFENLKKKDYLTNIFIVKLSYGLIFAFCIIGLFSSLLFPFFVKIILPIQFHNHLYLLTPLIFGFVFEAIYYIVSPYLFYAEKTKYNGYIGVTIAIFNVSLNLFLIPYIGIYGAAITACCSWVLLAITFFVFSSKVYSMPWLYFMNKK